MPLYDYECGECGYVFENIAEIKNHRRGVTCPNCKAHAPRIMPLIRQTALFQEGVWDIGQTEQHITSRKGLVEAFKRHNGEGDEFTASYPVYLDGMAGTDNL